MKKIFTFCALLLFAQLTFATVYYISSSGNDSNTGTSPAQAWESIDQVNLMIASAEGGDQFLFNRGDVFIGQIPTIPSGKPGNPIVFGAFGSGPNPVMSGAKNLTGWTNYSGNIWYMQPGEEVKQLFVEGTFQQLARYPNTGFIRVSDFSASDQLSSSELTQPNGYWDGTTAAIRTNEWTYEMMTVSSHIGDKLNFTLDYDTHLNNGDPGELGNGFFLYNKFEELDAEGEWYYDDATARVYVYSLTDPNSLLVEGSIHDWGINGEGNWHIKHITIQDISFSKQALNGVWFAMQCEELTIQRCEFTGQGRDGIELWGNDLVVTENVFKDILGRGLFVRECDGADFSRNTVSDIGLFPGFGVSGWMGMVGFHLHGVDNASIAYNTFTNTGYTALEANVMNSVVEKNIIKNACLNLSDGAGIHTWGWSSYNSIYRNNIIMNVFGNHESYHDVLVSPAFGDPAGIAVYGIYLDNYTHGHTVENNTIINTANGGVMVNSEAYDHTITGNHIFDTPSTQIAIYDNDTDHYGTYLGMEVSGNICYSTTTHFAQTSVRLVSVYDNWDNLGIFDDNFYVNPNRDKVVFRGHYWIDPTDAAQNLGEWIQVDPSQNGGSEYVNEELVIYTNESDDPMTFPLAAAHDDLEGNTYPTSVTVAPFSSKVLIGNSGGTSPHPANAHDDIPAYNAGFQLGVNMKAVNGWTLSELGNIAIGNPAIAAAEGAGVQTVRLRLQAEELETNGYASKVAGLNHMYTTLGARNITAILGYPSDSQQDTDVYCGSTGDRSELFADMYEPIWDGGLNGTPVNENNPYAMYVFQTVNTYKDYVKIWTPLDSVDFDDDTYGWLAEWDADNWWTNDPDPCHLLKLKAPIQNYVRMLRITYEVVKSIDPTAYVSIGGIKYHSFLDAVLRNTDNPSDGAVDPTDYPFTGGAYFDILSFEAYPHSSSIVQWYDGGWNYNRTSDAAAQSITAILPDLTDILEAYDYTGYLYPKKYISISRTGIDGEAFDEEIGGPEVQRNFIIKAAVEAESQGLISLYYQDLVESLPSGTADDPGELMGLYENLSGTGPYAQQATEGGIAMRTTAELLDDATFNTAQTALLNLPAGVKGGAYLTSGGQYCYFLWAETQADSETASITYSFPGSMGIGQLTRTEWDESETGSSSVITPNSISLSAAPSFFLASAAVSFPVEFLTFEATPEPGNQLIHLEWATASEFDNDYFTIERSIDGVLFEALENIQSQGNSTQIQRYDGYDLNPVIGTSFYRLRQTDLDGTFTYSQVIEIDFDQQASGFLVAHPVPVSQGEDIRVEFQMIEASDAVLTMKNVNGQTVWSHTETVSAGRHEILIPTQKINKGYYYVVVSNHQEVFAQKVAITK